MTTRKRGQLPQQGERPVEGRVRLAEAGECFVLEVYGKPAQQGSKNVVNRRVMEDNPYTKPWRERIARVCQLEAGWVALDGSLEVELHFVFDPPKGWDRVSDPTTRATYDIDKLCRAALDAIVIGAAVVDDARISRLTAEKTYLGQQHALLTQAGAVIAVSVRSP